MTGPGSSSWSGCDVLTPWNGDAATEPQPGPATPALVPQGAGRRPGPAAATDSLSPGPSRVPRTSGERKVTCAGGSGKALLGGGSAQTLHRPGQELQQVALGLPIWPHLSGPAGRRLCWGRCQGLGPPPPLLGPRTPASATTAPRTKPSPCTIETRPAEPLLPRAAFEVPTPLWIPRGTLHPGTLPRQHFAFCHLLRPLTMWQCGPVPVGGLLAAQGEARPPHAPVTPCEAQLGAAVTWLSARGMG